MCSVQYDSEMGGGDIIIMKETKVMKNGGNKKPVMNGGGKTTTTTTAAATTTAATTTKTQTATPAVAKDSDSVTANAPPPAPVAFTSNTSTTTSDDDHHDYNHHRYSRVQKEDKDQAIVATPYGAGLVIRTRRNPVTHNDVVSRDIELIDWAKSKNQTFVNGGGSSSSGNQKYKSPKPPMLYSFKDFPSVPPQVGDDVLCGTFGRGKVVSLDTNNSGNNNQQARVVLTSWRLAGRSKVTCTVRIEDLQVVRPKLQYEMDVFERVEHAQSLKEEARQAFAKKKYEQALTKYALAVDAVRYVQHDANSTNHVRADLLVIMITCCNNAATCAAHQPSVGGVATQFSQDKWQLTLKYANNALVLIDALEDRQKEQLTTKKPSKVYQILTQEDKISPTKLFGEWKGKALLFIARAHAEKHAHDKALEALQKAHEAVSRYLKDDEEPSNKILLQHEKDIQRLRTHCQQRKKKELKKEKQRAQAMFGGNNSNSNSNSNKNTVTESSDSDSFKNGTEKGSLKATSIGSIHNTSTSSLKSSLSASNNYHNNEELMMTDDSVKRRRNVTFEDGGKPTDAYVKPGSVDKDNDQEDSEDSNLPWYVEHQELIILITGLAVVGLGVAQMFSWQRRNR